LAMLLNSSGRGIKDSFASMDVAVSGLIEAFYFYNLAFPKDGQTIMGDCHIHTNGTYGVLVEEVRQAQIREFLQLLSSPAVLDLLGPVPMIEAMRQYSELLKVDVDGLLPSKKQIEDIIKARQQAAQEAQAAQAQAQAAVAGAKAAKDQAQAEKAISDAGISKARTIAELARQGQQGEEAA